MTTPASCAEVRPLLADLYAEGIGAEEAERVNRHLAACSACGRLAMVFIQQDRVLSELAAEAAREAVASGIRTRIQGQSPLAPVTATAPRERSAPPWRIGTRGRVRRRFWKALAAAAAALVALAGLFSLVRKGTPEAVARVEAVERNVLLLPDRTPVVRGQGLATGQGLETDGEGSRAVIGFPDGTQLQVGAGTLLRRLGDGDGGKRITLTHGNLHALVAKQPAGLPMVFETPQSEVTVLGTTLRLVVDRDPRKGTRLEVDAGKVRLKNLAGLTVVVPTGHCAVAAMGVELAAKPIVQPATPSSGRALISRMPPNSWLSVPDTKMRAVLPRRGEFPGTWGIVGPEAVVDAWSGGIFDTKRDRLVLWGGRGAGDYRGNELYAFGLSEFKWERFTDPFVHPAETADANPDGTPTSWTTYNGLAYIAHADRFFAAGARLSGDSSGTAMTWAFDFSTRRWTDRRPPSMPPAGPGSACSYDSSTRKVWWASAGRNSDGLWSYDYDRNTWTRHNSDDFYDQTTAVDTRRRLLVVVGRGGVFSYDLRTANPARQVWATTGGEGFIAKAGPGLDYDEVGDRIVGWHGGAVFSLNPDTRAWRASASPGAPSTTPNGVYGRWRYVPVLDAFVVVTRADENVHFYKPMR